jgi:ATP-dependent RNA helicase RhlE
MKKQTTPVHGDTVSQSSFAIFTDEAEYDINLTPLVDIQIPSRQSNFNKNQHPSQSYSSRNSSDSSGQNKRTKKIDTSHFVKPANPTLQADFVPKKLFHELPIHQHIKRALRTKGFSKPSPIQDATIGHVLRGKDIIGIANTGTGKTAAFLIPLVHRLLAKESKRFLVLAPTRELVDQIEHEAKELVIGSRLFTFSVTGGRSMKRQIEGLKRRNHILVATPGRLLDLAQKGEVSFDSFDCVVLDEMDMMLDMGFIDDIENILKQFPQKRHILMFSATLEPKIEAIAKSFMVEPMHISVKTGRTTDNVDQNIIMVPDGSTKIDTLMQLLDDPKMEKVVIFDKTKRGVEELYETLKHHGYDVESIHGDRTQQERSLSLRKFKQDLVKILIATNVAARGLDIPKVSHVINYDTPENLDDYTHRIGRAGRNGNIGYSLTFVE